MSYNISLFKNVGAWVKHVLGFAPVDLTAAGSGDNTEITGPAIDRDGYLSAVIVVAYTAALNTGETLAISNVKFEHSLDSSGTDPWADYVQPAYAGAADKDATIARTAATTSGVVEFDVNLEGAKRYVRVQATPDLSRAGTDTATVAAVVLLAGRDHGNSGAERGLPV